MEIGKQESVTHSLAWLHVLHFERPFLQSERHKDRKLSLVLDLEPGSTFHLKDFPRGGIFHINLIVNLNLGREMKPLVLPIRRCAAAARGWRQVV